MSSKPIRRLSSALAAGSSVAKKPAASVKAAPPGDFVSIQNRAVLFDKLEEIANLANEATGADGIAIALGEDDQFVCRASLGFAPEIGVAVQPGQGICGQCLAESRLVLAQDLTGEVKSALAAPVVLNGKVQGLIAAFSFRGGAFAASHSDLLCCLASDIAQGLDSLDSIHLVTRESLEFVPPLDPDIQPSTRDERLAIIEAVTSSGVPATAPTTNPPQEREIEVSVNGESSTVALAELSAADAGNSEFHFMGYSENSDAVSYDLDEATVSQRPFRNHWDVVIILAAILIAALTFGIWLHHRHNQPYRPYTGQLANPPATLLSLSVFSSPLITD